jgi:hypothetical protein
MKSLTHLSLFAVFLWGCSPQPAAELLPPGYFIPTLAAAAALTTDSKQPSPVTPDNPSGVCPNCNGKGRVGDGTVETICVVCDGTGKVTNDTKSLTLSRPTPPIAAIPSGKHVSDRSQGEASYQTGESGQTQQPPADNYTSINYVPVEQALAESQRTGKPIWIHVYADGWCSECIRLARDVLTDKEVIKSSRNFVCAKVEWKHPWRPKLVGDANGVPLDLFGPPTEWKALRRHLCPKTVEGYVKKLQTQGVQ